MTIVDTHTHVISPDTARYPTDPIGGRQSTWSQAHPVDAEGLIHALDEAGITKAVVVQASTVYGHDNRYLSDSVRAHPDRFVGVYSIDATAPDAVEKIQHWQGAGLRGFRLFTTGTTLPGQANWLGHESSHPAWAYAEQHGIPICLQMTMEGLGTLRGLLERFPRVRVLLDHCARPDLSDGAPYRTAHQLFEIAEFPGVHLKLTHRALAAAADGASRPADFVEQVVTAYGADRITWGSNFPAVEGSLSAQLTAIRGAIATLDDEQRRLILGGTAESLYSMTIAAGEPS
jgi:L-fuconolactonase